MEKNNSVEDINKELDAFYDEMDLIDQKLKIPSKFKDVDELDSLMTLLKSEEKIDLMTELDKHYYPSK